MFVLGIDTATLVCSVAVVNKEKTLAEYMLQVKKTHSERLLPLIADMLRDTGLKPRDLDGIAVAAGPGSFTGLRIGIVTAKAFGQALELPLCGISTLTALAAQHPWFNGLICPILDARREQVYNALFRRNDGLQRLTDDRTVTLQELLTQINTHPEAVLFVGDAVSVHRQEIEHSLGGRACFMPPESAICRASTVARLGLDELSAGRGRTWRDLVPQYIRRSEAEVKLMAKQGKGGDDNGCLH